MSAHEPNRLAVDEAQLLSELNQHLYPLGVSVTDLRVDLQDPIHLLTLLSQGNAQVAINLHKTEMGSALSETQATENRMLLCKILNDFAQKDKHFTKFQEADVLSTHVIEAVRLVLCIIEDRTSQSRGNQETNGHVLESLDQESSHQNEPVLEWINFHLSKIDLKAKDLDHDFHDGFLLLHLINIISENPVSDFHSRVFKDVAIENHVLMVQNRDKIQQWLKENGEEIVPSEFEILLNTIVWKLVGISLGVDKIEESTEARIELAKKVFKKLGIPFLFRRIEEKGIETEVVLVASMFKDKLDSAKAGDQGRKLAKWVAPPQRYMTTRTLDDKILEEGVLRIFLSSTFRDMQRERDQFFKNGAPKLISLAKSKGLELVFIDLRWGLTAEESGDGLVVIRCCDSIKKCAYFVCFLGARYGWVPDSSKTELNKQERLEDLMKTKPTATMQDIWVEWHSTTNQQYPFLDDMPGLSVTEYEIQYAALTDNPACSRVFFYFRDEKFAIENALTEEDRKLYAWETDGDLKLSAEEKQKALQSQIELKAKIASKFGAVTYQDPENFCDLVTSHLSFAIDKDFSGRQVREPEDQAHHQFMQHRLAGFGGRQELLKKIESDVIDQLQSEEKQVIILAAESGIGKSSLMAATVRELKTNFPDTNIIFHFVGCTNLSNYVESISIRFWKCVIESNPSLDIESKEIIKKLDFQKEGIQGLFKFVETHLANHKFVFLIDAINQLHPSQDTPVPNLLAWLPKKTPKNVALIVSTIDSHESCKTIQSLGLSTIPVTKLTEDEIKQGAESFLDRYDKKVNSQQMQLILDDSQDTGHPLYLRLFLEEVRIFGVYERLTEEIRKLLSTDGVVSLYNLIITRWETKFNKEGAKMVETAMKVLYVSRIGLSEGDLDKYINEKLGVAFNLAEWKTFFFTLIESLFVRNGRYMYFHQLLFEAVKYRFLENEELLRAAQKDYAMWLLGQYSNVTDSDEELVAEICYQLLHGQCYEVLVEYLKNEHVVESMLRGRYRYEFFNCWRKIHEKGTGNYKDAYKSLVQSLTPAGDLLVDFFLESFENTFLASHIPTRIAKRTSEESKESDYLSLGRVFRNIQSWDESLQNFNKCLSIQAILGQRNELTASILDEIGAVFLEQKRFQDAADHFSESLSLRKQFFGVNDIRIASSYDNIGRLHMTNKSFGEAIESFNKALEIREKAVGKDHPLVATSLSNLADVDTKENRLKEALEKLEKAKGIRESSLGPRHPSVASTLSLSASIFETQKEKKKAADLWAQASAIFTESLGENHKDTTLAYERRGDLEHELRSFNHALDIYKKLVEIRRRTIGEDHPSFATALENVARTNFELKRNDQVAEYLVPAIKIRLETSTKTSFKDGSQCARIAEAIQKGCPSESVFLFKEAIRLYCEQQTYVGVNPWKFCLEFDSKFKSAKKHKDAFDFWMGIRDMFQENLGWLHQRTLLSCEYASFHSKEIGLNRQPIEFTNYANFIRKETETPVGIEKFNIDKVCALLLSIVYSSRANIAKAKPASDAITLLNFMNIPLSGLDFSGVRIPNANLNRSYLDGTDFTGADLSGVNLNESFLGNCILNESNMEDVKFEGVDLNDFEWHKTGVTSICSVQGPNGECWLASGSVDSTIRLWDAKSGALVRILEGHTKGVNSICSLKGPNGKSWLVSGGGHNDFATDNSIRIWDVATGAELNSWTGLSLYVTSVCSGEGPNGECWLAYSGSRDNNINVCNATKGAEKRILKGHTMPVFSICSVKGPNGESWLASGGCDRSIRVWDVLMGTEIKILNGHANWVTSVCAVKGPKGEIWLASGSYDHTIRIWDVESGSQIKVLKGHTDWVDSVCCIPRRNGECWLASGGQDLSIRIWDVATGFEIKRIHGHTWPIKTVCGLNGPNGECWLASGSGDKTIRMLEIVDGFGLPKSTKHELSHSHEVEGESKDQTDASLSLFKKFGTASQITKEEEIIQSKVKFIIGPRRLEGGNIQLRNVVGINPLIKTNLLKEGGVSYDADFVGYCNTGKPTKFQSQMMEKNYTEGWCTGKDTEKATEWHLRALHIALDFDTLLLHAQKGSKDAFNILLQLANEKLNNSSNELKHLKAIRFVSKSYAEGWGVEKDEKLAQEWHYQELAKNHDFEALKLHAAKGSKLAFDCLMKVAEEKSLETGPFSRKVASRVQYSDAAKAVAECFSNGWCVEKDEAEADAWNLRAIGKRPESKTTEKKAPSGQTPASGGLQSRPQTNVEKKTTQQPPAQPAPKPHDEGGSSRKPSQQSNCKMS